MANHARSLKDPGKTGQTRDKPKKCQSSLLTQQQHLLPPRAFWFLAKQIGDAGPGPHPQALGNPFQAHGCLPAQPAGDAWVNSED